MDQAARAFENKLRSYASAVEERLDHLLGPEVRQEEIARPARLLEAMHYGALNGGKRLRPLLVAESTRLFGGYEDAALQVGCALECIHSYSLVHDDLPAMDDDDLRRGKPTVHIAYDYATAILAGDGLLTYAFDILASDQTDLPDSAKIALVLSLSRAAGIGGMAGGQALDLAAETEAPDEQGIVTLQAMKTGALIRFACEAGAIIAQRPEDDRRRLRRFGEIIGRAFQLADDLLDVTADAQSMGKATGKDAGKGKGTLVAMRGIAWATTELDRLVAEAKESLLPYGAAAEPLNEIAHFVATRKN
ncbi:polyprenyl synthetase family protein [Peteryoungia ipomoeae]|uniref:Probable farnesyl diphosphate synthase n=1 Tax=Peteryoungia ipomoeae TaxID=1210932 RepID=A0A4S8NXJ9_9HYPH|nr:farnesyl diphosphate synthase [Peteryoungia ipomoeae]THV22347.1 polyprenyl synthetase family protein [Peteryoungia ipomoeae]